MKVFSTIACGLIAASMAFAPAMAATTISLGSGTNSAEDGTDGNVRSFNAGGIKVQATAFSYNSSLSRAWLGQYASNGLGVTNSTEGNGSTDNSHTVDNASSRDFIMLVFDQAVNLSGAVLNPFKVSGSTDNDAFVSFGTLAGAFNETTPVTIALNSPIFSTLLTNGKNFQGSGSGAITNFNTGASSGNVWIIGAARSDYANWDGTIDGFKLGAITVTPTNAVPEPATWAMMIGGFGVVGVAMRRRRRIAAGLTTAAA